METKYPLISIGLPTYNRSKRLERALNSIWAQQYPNLEVIISDNCSQDDTEAVCQAVRSAHPEVKYIRQQENLGILRNFEFVLAQATGKYFMWLSDDDVIEPGTLFKYVDFLENHDDYLVVSGRIRYWRDGKVTLYEEFTLDKDSPAGRMIQYYGRVRWGAMVYGLTRREIAQKIPVRKVWGMDYHFVANVVYLGKMKTLDFIGYSKFHGGSSGNWVKFAKSINEPAWVGYFPFVKISIDAFRELYRSPSFHDMSFFKKFIVAVSCGFAVLYNNYPQQYAEVAWKKLKNFFSTANRNEESPNEQIVE